eukprot:2597376-Amphidinium_carterae.6
MPSAIVDCLAPAGWVLFRSTTQAKHGLNALGSSTSSGLVPVALSPSKKSVELVVLGGGMRSPLVQALDGFDHGKVQSISKVSWISTLKASCSEPMANVALGPGRETRAKGP